MIKNEKGFTLIEIMVVLLVIGILLAISIPNLTNVGNKAHLKGCEANQRLIRSQLENYKLETGAYPTGADTDTIFNELIAKKLIKKKSVCPAKGSYVFTNADGTIDLSTTMTIAEDVKCSNSEHKHLGE